MQISANPISATGYQPNSRPVQSLDEIAPFAHRIADEFRAGHADAASELELLRLSSRLKRDVLEQTADFDPFKGAFGSEQTALKIAVAAATAGAIDAVIFWQTQDTPLLMSGQTLPDQEPSKLFDEVRQTMDASASAMTNLSRGQSKDPEFALKRLPRTRNDLVEDLQAGSAGPGGYFQLGYRLGALSGLAAGV